MLAGSSICAQAAPSTPTVKPKSSPASRTSTPPKANAGEGVRALYQSAMALVQAGKTQDAMDAFDRLLRRFPGHQPALLQQARLLYQVDRIPEAYQAFARINPVGLDADVSYEYALCHFWMRQYERALYGFQRVPNGHPLADLANYYGGISALKLRRLVEAESMMDKAVVLPEKLAQSRTAYIKHISELKFILEKKGLSEERERERKRVEAEINKRNPEKLSIKETRDAQIRAYRHNGFELVEIAPIVGHDYKSQIIDKHGFSEETANLKTSYFEFKSGPLLRLPLKYGADQGAVGLQITARAEEQSRSGRERRNIQSDTLDDIQRIESRDTERTLIKYATLAMNPWIEVPSSLNIWFGFGGGLSFKYPDFETKDRSGVRRLYLQAGSKTKDQNAIGLLRYQFAQIVDADNRVTIGVHKGTLDANMGFLKIARLYGELHTEYFSYEDETIPGPTSTTSLSVDQEIRLPIGFSAGLKASGAYLGGYLFKDIPSYGDLEGDGQTYTGKIYLAARPIRWIEATLSQEFQKTVWTLHDADEETTDAFEQNTPDYQETFQAGIRLNLFF